MVDGLYFGDECVGFGDEKVVWFDFDVYWVVEMLFDLFVCGVLLVEVVIDVDVWFVVVIWD